MDDNELRITLKKLHETEANLEAALEREKSLGLRLMAAEDRLARDSHTLYSALESLEDLCSYLKQGLDK